MRTVIIFLVLSVLMLLFSAVGRAAEEKISIDKLPKAVLDAAKAKFPDAKVVGAEKDEEDGKTVYEVVLKDKGQNVDVLLSPEGTIVEIEKTIPVKDVPSAVSEALETKHSKATVKKAEEIFKDDKLTAYELLIVTSDKKQRFEIVFDPNGKFVKEEEKKVKEQHKKKD